MLLCSPPRVFQKALKLPALELKCPAGQETGADRREHQKLTEWSLMNKAWQPMRQT